MNRKPTMLEEGTAMRDAIRALGGEANVLPGGQVVIVHPANFAGAHCTGPLLTIMTERLEEMTQGD